MQPSARAPSISLCVIARDEERLLPRMLASARPAVDEIILVDTGSSDATVAIARRFGARVLHHRFADDFSAARNVSLAAATSPWILVLDADEELAPGTAEQIRKAVREPGRAGFYLRFDNDLGEGRSHVCAMMRLFKSDPAVRYRYLIHEQVIPDLVDFARSRGLTLGVLDRATVLHDGYLPARSTERSKDERNMRLFRRQVELWPDHAYSWYKFGDFLRRFRDRSAEALETLARAADLVRAMTPAEARDLSFAAEVFALLAVDLDKAGRHAEARTLADEGLQRFGRTPNLMYVLGHLAARSGDHRASLGYYARLRSFAGKLLAVPPEPGVTGPIAFLGMGRALLHLGRSRAAARCLEKSLEANPRQPQALLMLARALLSRGDAAGAAARCRAALEIEPKNALAATQLASLELARGAASNAERTLREARAAGAAAEATAARLGEALFAQGRFDEAFVELQAARGDADARAGLGVLAALARGQDLAAGAAGPAQKWLRHLARLGVGTRA